jgi:hypothetical protein
LSAASSSSGGGKELVVFGVEAQDLPVELPLLEREGGREGERERGREGAREKEKEKETEPRTFSGVGGGGSLDLSDAAGEKD